LAGIPGHNFLSEKKTLKEHVASYLDLAEFIQFSGASVQEDLHQLWRRIVFHIAVSNTDDHLRNHGFILTSKGWRLSPAYDINPSIDKEELSLNIDMDDNALNIDLAISVGEYFQLTLRQMQKIIAEVSVVLSIWRKIAEKLSIPRKEQEMMAPAFRSEK